MRLSIILEGVLRRSLQIYLGLHTRSTACCLVILPGYNP